MDFVGETDLLDGILHVFYEPVEAFILFYPQDHIL